MNFSRNISYRAVARRFILTSILIGGIIGLLGFVIGYMIHPDKPVLIYGLPDGKIYQLDASFSWERDNDFVYLSDVPLSEDIQRFIFYLSSAYEIDYPLVLAIIERESQFEADTISPTNDYGLMQVNRINHAQLSKELGVNDFLDPYSNVKAGMFMLRKLFEKYEAVDTVLMAYNMGESGAKRLWAKGIFESKYSNSVCAKADEYRIKLTNGGTNNDTL